MCWKRFCIIVTCSVTKLVNALCIASLGDVGSNPNRTMYFFFLISHFKLSISQHTCAYELHALTFQLVSRHYSFELNRTYFNGICRTRPENTNWLLIQKMQKSHAFCVFLLLNSIISARNARKVLWSYLRSTYSSFKNHLKAYLTQHGCAGWSCQKCVSGRVCS